MILNPCNSFANHCLQLYFETCRIMNTFIDKLTTMYVCSVIDVAQTDVTYLKASNTCFVVINMTNKSRLFTMILLRLELMSCVVEFNYKYVKGHHSKFLSLFFYSFWKLFRLAYHSMTLLVHLQSYWSIVRRGPFAARSSINYTLCATSPSCLNSAGGRWR